MMCLPPASPPRRQPKVRFAALVGVAAFALSACGSVRLAEPPRNLLAGGSDGPVAVYPGAQQAFFASFPQDLLAAAEFSCSNPGQTLRRPTADSVVCETLPSPEGAAALILAHGGTVENLPRLYTTFISEPRDGGFLVSGDSYVTVPQRTGGAVQLRLPEADAGMRDLLAGAGGQPISAR